MNIVLFGYRGSGKSTIGRKLADQLWKDFVDTDDAVCRELGVKTIAEAWESCGESAFRDAEADVTQRLLARDEQVIALGGGTVTVERARAAVADADSAIRIYLKCEPEELYRRIKADPKFSETRPDLPELGGSVDRIRETLARREPIYESVADHVFDVTDLDLDGAVRHLIKRCL
jgi:shikimate kinase